MTIPSLPAAPVIAHRGASGYAPENTLAAFRKAAEIGARWVEFDAKLTRDDHVILMHDDDLGRTTNGRGRVADVILDDLRRLDAGSWFAPQFAGEPVPTLSEAIAVLAELGLGANVEIKPCRGREEETAHIVAAQLLEEWPAGLPRPLISSFCKPCLAMALVVAPEIDRALLLSRVRSDWRDQAEMFECRAIHTNARHLGRDQASAIRGAGYALRCYTVNDGGEAAKLFGWGIDGVFSDYPDRIAPTN